MQDARHSLVGLSPHASRLRRHDESKRKEDHGDTKSDRRRGRNRTGRSPCRHALAAPTKARCLRFVRTTLLLASTLALVGFLVYPTAPPRLAGIGIADTVSNGRFSLNRGLVSSLYNPYAAVPSMHIGYALIIGASLLLYARRPPVRALGALYSPFVLLVVVATGNHFFFDAATGAVVAVVAAAAAAPDSTRRSEPDQRVSNATGSAARVRGVRGVRRQMRLFGGVVRDGESMSVR